VFSSFKLTLFIIVFATFCGCNNTSIADKQNNTFDPTKIPDTELTINHTFHESGNKATETRLNAQGQKHGLYKEWYPDGHLQVEQVYNEGELVSNKLLGKDGKVYKNIVIKNGREYGLLFSSFCLNGVTKDIEKDSLIFNPKN